MGLWDQHLALKWVHKNIEPFGGDNERVTLFGESAGASSVIFQSFYPENKGLYQRVIAQSGTMFDYWAFTDAKTALKYTRRFAKSAGCKQEDTKDRIDCLRRIPSHELRKFVFKASFRFSETPVFDNDFVQYLPETIMSGKSLAIDAMDMFNSVDLILGYNNGDSLLQLLFWAALLDSDPKANITITRNKFEETIIPAYLKHIYHKKRRANVNAVIPSVIREYTDWDDPDLQKPRKNKLLQLINDLTYTITAAQTARLHTRQIGTTPRQTKTYVYRLSARPPEHLLFVPDSLDGPDVANHMDDIVFLFGKQINTEQGQKQLHTYRAIMTLWTNFAKSGNPSVVHSDFNITWPEFGESHNYLEIQPEGYVVKQRFKQREVNYWTNVAAKIEDSTSDCGLNTAVTFENNLALQICICYIISLITSVLPIHNCK